MGNYIVPARRDWADPVFDRLSGVGLFCYHQPFSRIVLECRGRLCYLATPYTKVVSSGSAWDWNPATSVEAAVRAARCSRALAVEGVTAVSPVIQSVEMIQSDIAGQSLNPLDGAFWKKWCAPLLRASEVVILPNLPGWAESDGVWAEVRYALNANTRVFLMDVSEIFEEAV